MSSERIIHFDERGEPTKTARTQHRSLPKLLENIRDHAIDQLKSLFKEMLDGADDALFDSADKARSNKDQSLFFDSMRELRIKRKGMENIFGQQLLNKFKELQNNQTESDDELVVDELPLDSFALVQEDELEENLAIDSMVDKARKRNRVAIQQVETRLDTILANVRIEHNNNPVDPRNICEAFREASHTLELDIKAKLIVYKLFDRMVVAQFEDVYEEINQFLIEKGVLPELHNAEADKKKKAQQKKQAAKKRAAASKARAESDDDDYNAYDGGGSPDGVGAEVLGALRELLAVQRGGGVPVAGGNAGVAGAGVAGMAPAQGLPLTEGTAVPTAGVVQGNLAPVVDNQQLINALSSVQNAVNSQSTQANTYMPVTDLRGQIGTILPIEGPVSSQSIGQANDDVIDIISMLFDFILDDKNLPDEFKALIGRLQIPMLKVAILDDTFFSKGNHPARKLLNEMARAGIGWTKEVTGGVGLRAKVEEIVTHIIDEFDDDTSMFDGLLDEFHAFLEEQQKRALIVEKRTREAEEGKAKAESARYKVESALNEIVGDREMPDAVNRLLFEAWENVMLLDYLKEGEDAESWKKNLDTAQKMVDTLEPPQNKEQRKQLTSKLANLVKNIKAGLDAVAYGEFESAQLFQELEQIHLKVLKGESVFIESTETTEDSETLHSETLGHETLDSENQTVATDVNEKTNNLDADENLAEELAQVEVENVDGIFAEEFDEMEEIEFSDDDLEKLNDLELAQKTGTVASIDEPEDLELLAESADDNSSFIEEIDMSVPAGFSSEDSDDMGSLPEDDEFLQKVEELQVGCWFEVRDFEKPVRCKLAAIIPSVGKYIFVNRTGVKVAEFTKPGLALAFRRDEINQLNDGALFDRALESIVTNLRSLKKTQDAGIQ